MDTSAAHTNQNDPSDGSSARDASERSIQAQVLLAVGSLPTARLWRQQAGHVPVVDRRDAKAAHAAGFHIRYMELAPPGAADLCGVLADGRILQLEVKSETGYLGPNQKLWGQMIQKFGGVYACVRSVEEAIAAVERAVRQ